MATSRRIAALALLGATAGAAQFGVFRNLGFTPQAQTADEFDSFLEIVAESDPRRRVERVAAFASRFSESELLGTAFHYRLEACVELDDIECVLRAGRIVLERIPDNLDALLTLASSIPNAAGGRPDAARLLHAAEGYARRALEILQSKRIPRSIPFADWSRLRLEMEAQAHEALGHVAAKRGDFPEAVREFERATELSPEPVGRQHFRLGVAYSWLQRLGEARVALETAAKLGPEPITSLAEGELARIGSAR